jgi:hypothetical protein
MSYLFSGTAEDMMRALFDRLKRAREGGPNEDKEFRQALICLVGLFDRLAQADGVDARRLHEFWHDACEALTAWHESIARYVHRTLTLAEGANDEEWYELCMRRSVIQLLMDHCAGADPGASIDSDLVADLDEELRRVGLDQGPMPKDSIPKGLPESHWWWDYPASPGSGARQ